MSELVKLGQVSVEYGKVESVPVQGYKHRFINIKVKGLDSLPEMSSHQVQIERGGLGVGRLIDLRPSPLRTPFGVAWNGDTQAPALTFDGWPGDEAEVRLEVWGT